MARLATLALLVLGLSLCRTLAIECSKPAHQLGEDIIATNFAAAAAGDVIEIWNAACPEGDEGCKVVLSAYPDEGATTHTFTGGYTANVMSLVLVHKDENGLVKATSSDPCSIVSGVHFSYDEGQSTFHTHEIVRFSLQRSVNHHSSDYVSIRSKALNGEEWVYIYVPEGNDDPVMVTTDVRRQVDELWLQYYTHDDNLVATSSFNLTVSHYAVNLTDEPPSLDDIQFGQPFKYKFATVAEHDSRDYVALYSHKKAQEHPCILNGTCLDMYEQYVYVPEGVATGTVEFSGINEADTVFARYIFHDDTASLAQSGERRIRSSGTVTGPSSITLGQTEPVRVDYVASQWDGRFYVQWFSYERAAEEGCVAAVEECGSLGYEYVLEDSPGSGTVSFQASVLREPHTVFFALMDSQYQLVHRTNNITVQVNVTLSVPFSVPLDGIISVSYAVSPGHDEGEWIGMYPAAERACTVAGTCQGGYVDYQYVPAGGDGVLHFHTTSQHVDGVFFVYHLSTDRPVFFTPDVVIDTSACTVTVGANVIAERPFVVRYTSIKTPDWDHYVALVKDGCTQDCDLDWRYLYGSSGVLIFTAPAQTDAANVRVEYRVAGDRVLSSAVTTVNAASTGNVPIWTPVSVAEGAEVNSMAGSNATFTLAAMDTKALEVHCEGVPGDRLFVQRQSSVGTTSTWTFAYTTDSTEHRSVYYPCCYAINADGLASAPRCFSITVYGTICTSWGDPHLSTFDGVDYDFQGHGDFWMIRPAQRVRAAAFGVQARFAPCSRGSGATCNQAIGLKEGNDIITVYFRSLAASSTSSPLMEVTHNHAAVASYNERSAADTRQIGENGVTLTVEEGAWEFSVTFKSGLGVKVTSPGSAATSMYINLPGRLFYVPAASGLPVVEGLCGVWDGVQDNDFRYYNVNETRFTLSPDASTQSIYTQFGLNWRVSEVASFFDYTRTGQSRPATNPASFNPAFSAEFDDATLEANANTFCGAWGMTAREVERCLFDVAVTSDLAVARATVQARITACQAEGGGNTCNPNAACPNSCSGLNGICKSGKCECFKGYSGTDCSASSDPDPDPSAAPPAAAAVPALLVALLAAAAMVAAPLM